MSLYSRRETSRGVTHTHTHTVVGKRKVMIYRLQMAEVLMMMVVVVVNAEHTVPPVTTTTTVSGGQSVSPHLVDTDQQH